MTDRVGRPHMQSVLRAAATVVLALVVVASGAVAPAAAQDDRKVVHQYQEVTVTNDGSSGSTTRVNTNDGSSGSTTRVNTNDGSTSVRVSTEQESSGNVRVKRLRNEVEVTNRRDGRVKIRSDLEVDRTSRPVVHAINTALAYASCVDCRTAALAFQIVVLSEISAPPTFDNHAAAVNDHCTTCDTLAAAYQFAVVGAGEVSLTRSGRSQLRDLERELRDLRRAEATGAELAAAAEAIAGQVLAVLQSEIILEPSDALGPLSRSAGVSVQLYREVDANPAP